MSNTKKENKPQIAKSGWEEKRRRSWEKYDARQDEIVTAGECFTPSKQSIHSMRHLYVPAGASRHQCGLVTVDGRSGLVRMRVDPSGLREGYAILKLYPGFELITPDLQEIVRERRLSRDEIDRAQAVRQQRERLRAALKKPGNG